MATKKKKRFNKALLLKVKEAILEEPKRLKMDIYLQKQDADGNWSWEPFDEPPDKQPPCGTVGCIAGWVCELSRKVETKVVHKQEERLNREAWRWEEVVVPHVVTKYNGRRTEPFQAAKTVLGITEQEAQELFLGYRRYIPYGVNPQTKRYANAVAKRIEQFIADKAAGRSVYGDD